MSLALPPNQYALLQFLSGTSGDTTVPDAASATGIDQSLISAAAIEMERETWVTIDQELFEEVTLLDGGRLFLDSGESLPEIRIHELIVKEGPLSLPDIATRLGVNPGEVGKVLRFLFSKKLGRKDKGNLVPPGEEVDLSSFDDIALLERLKDAEGGTVRLTPAESKRFDRALGELRSREFVKVHTRARRSLAITSDGQAIVQSGIEARVEKNQLEPELLVDGAWKDVTFRPYDVTADSAPAYPAKPHPLRRILDETRNAFLHMGFREIRGPYVESAFWDFDALFQPQDHPAREMQDTFYVDRPGRFTLPEKEIVDKVRATHENGWETGSVGWRYKWNSEIAQKVVLRTHTTAATVNAMREDPTPPRKVFLVGRVFRREKTDYKHLPEFHQVDGIIIDEKASLSTLLGTLAGFYRQMGFEKVKFRPAFFPYTEPSLEVFVRMESRGDWFELGGAGIFRPEVTIPFGCKVPVLAWGLGLERLAMKRYNITDIRKLYWSDFRWLEETPLCL